MEKVLVQLFYAMIKLNHFPCRWLDILDIVIEKGKGNRIRKLRVTQKIEADLQLLMRIFLGFIIVSNYENDRRTSKHDCGSRKGNLIDSSLLEKRFIFDLARK